MSEQPTFEGWCILELMGHRRLAGYLSEQAIGGASFIRLDVPSAIAKIGDSDLAIKPNWLATQLYSPTAVYCITPVTEDLARKVAANNHPAPVSRWELPPMPAERPGAVVTGDALDDEGQPDDEDDLPL